MLATRFAVRLAGELSDESRALLAPGQLEALQSNPGVLDPAAAEELRASFAPAGPEGARAADAVIGGLNAATAGAVGDAFALCVGVAAVSVVAALFLDAGRRTSADAS